MGLQVEDEFARCFQETAQAGPPHRHGVLAAVNLQFVVGGGQLAQDAPGVVTAAGVHGDDLGAGDLGCDALVDFLHQVQHPVLAVEQRQHH